MKIVDELSRRKTAYDGDVLEDIEGANAFKGSYKGRNKWQHGSRDMTLMSNLIYTKSTSLEESTPR